VNDEVQGLIKKPEHSAMFIKERGVIPTPFRLMNIAEHLFGEHDPLSHRVGFMGLEFLISNRVMPATVTACPAVIEPGVSSSWVKLSPLAGTQNALGAVEDVCVWN
jgi:hypothetical protein